MARFNQLVRARGIANLLSCILVIQLTTEVTACPYRYVGKSHTMCIHRPKACSGSKLLRSGGVTQQDKSIVLNVHNQLRSVVAMGQQRGLPAAENMQTMEWDDELASVAQRWADQCKEGHDKNRDVSRFEVGQNVAVVWTYTQEDLLGEDPDWETQIRSWYNELTTHGFRRNMINPFRFKPSTGHLTQILWAETNRVGCGFAYYYHRQTGYTKIYVCNYGPGGNFVGSAMYEIAGRPSCSNPNLFPSRQYRGLCDHGNSYTTSNRDFLSVALNSQYSTHQAQLGSIQLHIQ